jgi:membrane-bound lytic murein transglycosylase A
MRRAVPVLLAALVLGCPPHPPQAPELPLRELQPDELPAFADDLAGAGLDEALDHSIAWLDRVAKADPSRTFAFGRERVPAARVAETLRRFRELTAAHPTPAALADALRREFRVFAATGDGHGEVLFTGYYLPELRGSLSREGPYQVPLHRAPDDLVVARTRDWPSLSDDLVGRVVEGRFVPYPTRAEIRSGALDGKRAELLWVDSPVDAFFAEIQGSALVRLPDGTCRFVTYAGKNGQRYAAVGAELVRRGALRREEVSMQAIREWLAAHPGELDQVLAANPSYVFFRFADAAIGALGEPVTPERTIATDARVFPKGALALVVTERPVAAEGAEMRPFSRFVLDQDAGGAIKGPARVDVYFGPGAYAANAAGRMHQRGRLYYLLLR